MDILVKEWGFAFEKYKYNLPSNIEVKAKN